MNDFHTLMDELGNLLDITLIPNKLNACLVTFNATVSVQIEPDATGHSLILATKLGEIPAGKFRESLLALGMKYNNLYPRVGNFAYLAQQNELILFHSTLMKGLEAAAIEKLLNPFIALAEEWKTCIARGTLPTLTIPETAKKPSLFDLNPSR